MDSARTDAYLRRIEADRPAAPTARALRELHTRHLYAVPFENLSIHLPEDIVLDDEALVEKIVDDHRGGFCYELNGAFAALLTALGFRVSLLAARVHSSEGLGQPYDHLALRVATVDDPAEDEAAQGAGAGAGDRDEAGQAPGPWLADVGFGRHSLHPIRLDSRADQPDPGGIFRVADAPYGDLDVSRDGAPQYRLEQRPRVLRDFEATCWWHRTSPASSFTRSPVCSRPFGADGRITLSGRTLVVTKGEGRTERELAEDEVLAAYREHFGISLDHAPYVPAAS